MGNPPIFPQLSPLPLRAACREDPHSLPEAFLLTPGACSAMFGASQVCQKTNIPTSTLQYVKDSSWWINTPTASRQDCTPEVPSDNRLDNTPFFWLVFLPGLISLPSRQCSRGLPPKYTMYTGIPAWDWGNTEKPAVFYRATSCELAGLGSLPDLCFRNTPSQGQSLLSQLLLTGSLLQDFQT